MPNPVLVRLFSPHLCKKLPIHRDIFPLSCFLIALKACKQKELVCSAVTNLLLAQDFKILLRTNKH